MNLNNKLLDYVIKITDEENKKDMERNQFLQYLKTGTINKIQDSPMQTKDMYETCVGNDCKNGGYLVPKLLSKEIQSYIEQGSMIRKLANVQTVSGNYQNYLTILDPIGELGWVGETDNRPGTKTPGLNPLIPITLFEMYVQPRISRILLNDSYVDITSWLTKEVANAFTITETATFFNGNGISSPLGIFSTSGTIGSYQTIETATTAVTVYQDIVNLFNALESRYFGQNTAFVTSRFFGGILGSLSSSGGSSLVYKKNGQDMMLGFPIYYDDYMDDGNITTDKPLIFGDLKQGYTIYDAINVTSIRDDITEKQWVKFYMSKRVGASRTDIDAIKILKIK
jgi:hypothetical protein